MKISEKFQGTELNNDELAQVNGGNGGAIGFFFGLGKKVGEAIADYFSEDEDDSE